MRACKVYAIAGHTVLWSNWNASSLKSILDGELKWIERYILYIPAEVYSTGTGVLKVSSKQVDTLRCRTPRIHVVMAERRYQS